MKTLKNILLFPFKVIMYFFLGSYYLLLFIFFPVMKIYDVLSKNIFKAYKKKSTFKDKEPKEKPKNKNGKLELKREELIASLDDEEKHEKPQTYLYKALDSKNLLKTNYFIALSKKEVFRFLENEGFKVIEIKTDPLINLIHGPNTVFTRKLKNKDLIFWLTQLTTYLKAGIPLTNAMRILSRQEKRNKNIIKIYDGIIYQLTLGESFSTALEKQKNVFPAFLVNMIKAAEATGDLVSTLDDMVDYYTDVEETRKEMIGAMTYPLIVLGFSLLVVVFVLLYVIPQFQSIYADTGAELNTLTLFVIMFSDFLQNNFIILSLIFVMIIVVFVTLYRRIKSFRTTVQIILMKIPIIKNVIIYNEMTIFSKTFASLLKSNVPITESIDILTNITNNEIYRSIMITTIENIAKGGKISNAFENHWAIPDVAYYMIVTGESTGELAEMMDKVSNYYQTSHKTVINSLKGFIEPVLIIFLAIVVGGIVLSVMLPMFGLYGQLG